MSVDRFVLEARYPPPWVKHGLASGEYFEAQARAFAAEYPNRAPEGGTEHWRYGSFLHWLRQELSELQLSHLLEAALADPDAPMAGNILKAVVAHPKSTDEMLQKAQAAVVRNIDYYIAAAELEELYAGRLARGGDAA